MKKALEAVVIVTALALAAFIFQQWRLRRGLAARVNSANPAMQPGTDAENPADGAPPLAPSERGVSFIPMIKLSKPPKSLPRESAVPPPASNP